MKRYEIFEGNMERLEKKLNRIRNKCKTYGCEFSYRIVGYTFKEIESKTSRKHYARYIIVEVDGTAIINGWEFVATIDHTENGNIIRGFSDIEIPERYRTAPSICEHCHSNRIRKFTYLVRNKETGEFRQVGKSCLNDYTHGMSAEFVAQYISFFDTLIQEEAPLVGYGIEEYIDTREYLKFAAETIRCFGYVKADEDGWTTSNRALCYYDFDGGHVWSRVNRADIIEERQRAGFNIANSEQLVTEALSWIENEPAYTTYMNNLKTACAAEYSPYRNIGILASLFPAYRRMLKRKEEVEHRDQSYTDEYSSEYVGQPGDRIMIHGISVRCMSSWETQYGENHMYKIISEEGNVFIWKTQKLLMDGRHKISLIGTVKAHNEFRGIKQTEMTRCSVLEESEEEGGI